MKKRKNENGLEQFLQPGETVNTVSLEELKKRKDAARKRAERAADREEKAQANRTWDSTVELDEDEIRNILIEQGYGGVVVRHPRVLEVLPGLIQTAARNLRIPATEYLVTHGVEATLASRAERVEKPLPEVEDRWVPGSRIRRHEEHALWSFGMSWREFNGRKYTFEEFLALRRTCITDVYKFGKEILGLDLEDSPHGIWARELFVTKNVDGLPENYTWLDIKTVLAGLSPIHKRILAAARSTFKSSYNLVDMLSWVLAFGGDLRIFMVSSTKPLSAGFLKKFRSYWTVRTPDEPTLFQILYPEFMFQPGDDQGSVKSFTSPMRRLDLIQPTLNSSSIDSEGLAGERCDLFVSEDIAEISNSSTPEQRAKTLEKFLMLLELLEPFGYLQIIGTPISAGNGTEDDPGDVYTAMLAREKATDEKTLLHLAQPAWTVKPGVRKKAWDPSLTEDEVELLFPARQTFPWLMAKLRENLVTDPSAKIFRQQSLVLWVPDSEDELKLHFDENLLSRAVVSTLAEIPPGQNILTVDISFSLSSRADLTSLGVVRFYNNSSNRKSMMVLDIVADRMRGSETAYEIIMACRKYTPAAILIEKHHSWEALDQQIRMQAIKYSVTLPAIRWVPTSNAKGAKMIRIKNLEYALEAGRLKFRAGDYIDGLFAELKKLDGKPSNASKHDDRADCLALAAEVYRLVSSPDETKTTESNADAAREQMTANRNAMYGRVFGTESTQQPMQRILPAPLANAGGRFAQYQRDKAAAVRRGR